MDTTWWVDKAQLDDSQKEILKLPASESGVVLGPPGSGKTNLLLLRAKFVVRAGRPNVVFLTFNKSLRQFIARGAARYALPEDRIQTFMQWEMQRLVEYGGSLDGLPDEFADRRAEIVRRLLDRLTAVGAKSTFQTILVDEVQDCLPQEVEIFRRLGATLFAAGDGRQRIYETGDTLKPIISSVPVINLKYHYRCGAPICEVADGIASTTDGIAAIRPTCNYKDSDEPSVVRADIGDLDSQCADLGTRLALQLRAYPDELIAVGCAHPDQVDLVRATLARTKIAASVLPDEDTFTSEQQQRVLVTTLRKLKGLEFRAVNLLGLERASKLGPNQKRIGYTAVTRARTSLVVYASSKVPAWLETGLAAVNAAPGEPDIGELFGG